MSTEIENPSDEEVARENGWDGDGFEAGQSAEELERIEEITETVIAEGLDPDVPPAAPEYDVVDIEQIAFSPNNPRARFDHTFDERDRDLVASIRESGIHEPLLVRENCGPYELRAIDGGKWGVVKLSPDQPKEGKSYDVLYEELTERKARDKALLCARGEGFPWFELVAGARRLAAAQVAGLKEVPVIIKDLTDREAAEAQLVENLQRKDLSPMEEARGFGRMISEFGYSVEDLAGKIGKSPGWVYSKLQLRKLPTLAVEALEAGYLSEAVAVMVARMPAPEMRAQAAWDALRGWSPNRGDKERPPASLEAAAKALRCAFGNLGENLNPYDKRHAAESFARNYTRELKGALFDQKDAQLVLAAGSCKDCPKRTGNNRELYPDGRADICTDTTCYESKVKAYTEKLVAEAKERGQKVITGKAAEDLRYNYRSYKPVTESSYIGDKSYRVKDLIGKDSPTVLAVMPNGDATEYAAVSDINKAIKAKGLKTRTSSPADKHRLQEDRIRSERDRRVLKAVGEKAGKLQLRGDFLKLVALGMVDQAWHETLKLISTAHQLGGDTKGWNPENAVRKYVQGHAKPGPTVQIMAELAYLRARFQGHNAELLKFLKIDPARIEKEVRTDFKLKEAAKKKPGKGKTK